MLDVTGGTWQVAGQPTVTTGTTSWVVPSEIPIGAEPNIVRLVLYSQCLGYVAQFQLPNDC